MFPVFGVAFEEAVGSVLAVMACGKCGVMRVGEFRVGLFAASDAEEHYRHEAKNRTVSEHVSFLKDQNKRPYSIIQSTGFIAIIQSWELPGLGEMGILCRSFG